MTHINQRRDSAAMWAFENPVLMEGEVGWEEDTRRSKLGDGVSHWNDLLYTVSDPSVTAADIGLGNVDNTHDLDKPISTATQAALDVLDADKADLASPAFTGNPTAPTPSPGDNDTSLATTAFVKAAIDAAVTATLLAAHPVGSYYTSEVATDPATLFGGTWTRVKGKFIVGVDEADTTDHDWDAVNKTGGAKTVTLGANNLPAHTHALGGSTGDQSANHTHTSGLQYATTTTTGGTAYRVTDVQGATGGGGTGATATSNGASNGHTHALPANTGNNTTTGAAVDKKPPFVAAYIWKRTA